MASVRIRSAAESAPLLERAVPLRRTHFLRPSQLLVKPRVFESFRTRKTTAAQDQGASLDTAAPGCRGAGNPSGLAEISRISRKP